MANRDLNRIALIVVQSLTLHSRILIFLASLKFSFSSFK